MIRRRFMITSVAAAACLAAPAVVRATGFRTQWIADPRRQISLHWQNAQGQAYGSLARLHSHLERAGKPPLALCNAGIYAADNTPAGLHVEQGTEHSPLNRRKGRGNFHLDPNGVFWIDATGAHVARTSQYRPGKGLQLATQSGPLLFDAQGLHPRFLPRSTSRYIRNGVGVASGGEVALCISNAPLTFYDFALYMRDTLGCQSALYLDGGISLMWQAGDPLPFQLRPFVGMLAVTA